MLDRSGKPTRRLGAYVRREELAGILPRLQDLERELKQWAEHDPR